MVLEAAITTDYALVRVAVADRAGNCVFRGTAQNFNRAAATAGRITIVEAESVVEVGAIPPNEVDLPAIYVDRVVALTPAQAAAKGIEKRTTRGHRSSAPVDGCCLIESEGV